MPFELLFGEKARILSFPNEDIQKIHYGETSEAERFNLLQKLRAKAHQFATEERLKSAKKCSFTMTFFIQEKTQISTNIQRPW
jgi:hypothetical protein